MNRIISLISLTIILVSCNSIRTHNLTGRIVLEKIEENNDTVDFYIKQITLCNVERLKAYDVWGEDSPGFNLEIIITNKLNRSIFLMPSDWSEVYFIGIIPPELKLKEKDTIDFVNFFDDFPRLLEPESSVNFTVSNFGNIDERLFDLTRLDNTEPMLDLLRQLKFYYAPLPKEENIGQDTIVINGTYRLRTDANTKITSWSRIR